MLKVGIKKYSLVAFLYSDFVIFGWLMHRRY
jgi:hypothetical protein